MSAEGQSYDYAGKYQTGGVGGLLVERFYRSVAALVDETQPRSVLEVGCGEGFSTERLRRLFGPEVPLRAVEVEPRLVEATRRRLPGLSVRQGSVYALDEADASVDFVIALEVLEHLERPRDALAELRRVAGRWVMTSVPREPLWRLMNLCRLRYVSDLGNTPGHLQHWSGSAFRSLVGEYGDVLQVRTPLPWIIALWRPTSE